MSENWAGSSGDVSITNGGSRAGEGKRRDVCTDIGSTRRADGGERQGQTIYVWRSCCPNYEIFACSTILKILSNIGID